MRKVALVALAVTVLGACARARLQGEGAHSEEELRNRQLELQRYAYRNGIDDPEIDGWTWPHGR
jgi:hypothetical protein